MYREEARRRFAHVQVHLYNESPAHGQEEDIFV